jgi:hypothetical protein
MPYPVSVFVGPQPEPRNRLTTAVRLILAFPHIVLVAAYRSASFGLLGTAAYFLAIVSWFTLLITGEHISGIRDFSLYYLRWRTRVVAYLALFVDAYPPFGDAVYPASIVVLDPPLQRDRATIAVRLLLAIPHLLVLFFLGIGWLITTVIAWFAILFTGEYPLALYPFGVGVMRWMLRVEAYLLLLVDEYPPFELD